jgi:hypothetical protein
MSFKLIVCAGGLGMAFGAAGVAAFYTYYKNKGSNKKEEQAEMEALRIRNANLLFQVKLLSASLREADDKYEPATVLIGELRASLMRVSPLLSPIGKRFFKKGICSFYSDDCFVFI